MSRSVRIAVMAFVVALSLPLGLSGGATVAQTPITTGAYADAFAQARADATSDFERAVLADDAITQASTTRPCSVSWRACGTSRTGSPSRWRPIRWFPAR